MVGSTSVGLLVMGVTGSMALMIVSRVPESCARVSAPGAVDPKAARGAAFERSDVRVTTTIAPAAAPTSAMLTVTTACARLAGTGACDHPVLLLSVVRLWI